MERVIFGCDNIRNAVEMFLKSGSELPVSVSFPGDIFKFIFSSAFPSKFFTRGWDTYYDNLEGVKVEYPILLKHALSFSPKSTWMHMITPQCQTLKAFR